MKILMRNIGMTLHVIHTLRAQGITNVQVNMDWQHLLMNGERWRVRGAARRRGAARPPARELGLGHVRRRQHGRRDGVHGDARARARAAARRVRRRTASGSASTSTRTPRTGRGGQALGAAVALHRLASRRGSTTQALREAQQEKDAVARLRARVRRARRVTEQVARRPRRRHDRRQGDRDRRRAGDVLARAERGYPLSTPQPGWAEQDPEDWWRAAAGGARGPRRRAGRDRALRPDARARRPRRRRTACCGRRSSGTTSGRRRSAPRSRSASASTG